MPLIFFIGVSQCKQETFTPLPDAVLTLANAERPIEILSQPLKKEMIRWDGRKVPSVKVDGFLKIDYQDNQYDYLQITCPPELQCNASKAYVPVSMTTQFSNIASSPVAVFEKSATPAFLLLTTQDLNISTAVKAWLDDPGQDLPAAGEQEAVLARYLDFYLSGLEPAEREERLAGLYYLAISHTLKLRNESFSPFLKRYASYAKILEVAKGASLEKAGLSPGQDIFLKQLANFTKDRFKQSANDAGYDFPFQAGDHKGLAEYYNKKLKLPLYREMILQQILEDAPYAAFELQDGAGGATAMGAVSGSDLPAAVEVQKPAVEGGAAEPATPVTVAANATNLVQKVLFDLEFGAVVTYKNLAGKTQEKIFTSIEALADANGLSFLGETEQGEKILLKPTKLPSLLEAASPRTIPNFKKKSDEQIFSEKDYKRRLMLAAIKYGKGEYDRRERKFHFEVDLAQDQNFWKMLAVFKTAPAIAVSDPSIYSGELHLDGEFEKQSLRWYQKASDGTASMGVTGKITICERGCFDETVDLTCFDNSVARVTVDFSGKELSAETPQVDVQILFAGINPWPGEMVCSRTTLATYPAPK